MRVETRVETAAHARLTDRARASEMGIDWMEFESESASEKRRGSARRARRDPNR